MKLIYMKMYKSFSRIGKPGKRIFCRVLMPKGGYYFAETGNGRKIVRYSRKIEKRRHLFGST